ncbi:MAG: family 16 glycosylhydrolase [Nakamurella sp.]
MSVRSAPIALALSVALAAVGLGVIASGSVSAAQAAPTSWESTFRDDFNGSGLPNSSNWLLTLGTSYPGGPEGFGTGEIQTMTNNPRNVNVRNGNLYITPQRDASGQWTSARVETQRSNFKPADGGVMRMESRLQMPNVTGVEAEGYWPAFWALGSPYRADRWSWPGVGEFDIMENVNGLNWTYNVLHCGTWGGPCNEPEGINNGRPGNSGEPCKVTTCQAGFHTYAMEWDRSGNSDQLRWYLDGELTFTVNENQVPTATWNSLADHAGYFVILNVSISGAFPAKLGAQATPATKPGVPLVVDYVEVKYAGGQGNPTVPPTTTTTSSTSSQPTTSSNTSTSTSPSPTSSTTPSNPGGGPSNLRVTGTSSDSITIGWDGPSSASYDVLRSGQRIGTVTGRTYTDRGLLPNTPYLYSVRANGTTTPVLTATLNSSPGSSTGTATTTRTANPTTTSAPAGSGTPSDLSVASTTASSISLKWAGGAGHTYQVLRSGVPIATVTTATYTDRGLFRNTPYLYSIRGNGVTTPVLTASIP